MRPVFVLRHRSLYRPDGLAFSQCGRWLAVANHGNHTVGIYERVYGPRRNLFSRRERELEYGARPVSIIRDPALRHPHSVAFTPKTNHLVVTNAGANYFSVYRPEPEGAGMRWSQSSVLQRTLGPESIFNQINSCNKMEGGPKGIAIHKDNLAVCSPEHGIKIYSFRENTVGA